MKKGMKKSDVAKQISIVASDEVHRHDLQTNDYLHQF